MTRESAKSQIRSRVTVNKDYIHTLKFADDAIDQIYDDFEQQLKEAKDLRNDSVLISQEDVDFLQLQNQQYADTVAELEQQLANLKHNYEMQEIMIDDYKKRTKEHEAYKTLHQVTKMTREQAKELFKDCNTDFIIDKLYDYFTLPYTRG